MGAQDQPRPVAKGKLTRDEEAALLFQERVRRDLATLTEDQAIAVQALLQVQVQERLRLEAVIASMQEAQRAMDRAAGHGPASMQAPPPPTEQDEIDAEERLIAQTEALRARQKQEQPAPVVHQPPAPQFPENFEAVVTLIAERVAERVAVTRIREHMAQSVIPQAQPVASPPPPAAVPYPTPASPPPPAFLNYNPNAGPNYSQPPWPWRR